MVVGSRTKRVVSIAFAAAMFAVLGRGVASAETAAGGKKDLPPCEITKNKAIDQACNFARQGQIFYEQGRNTEAIASAQQAIKLNPKLVNTTFMLGESYFEIGQFDLALTAFTTAINLSSDLNKPEALAYSRRGKTYLSLEEAGKDTAGKNYKDLAKADFLTAIKTDPNFHEAYYALGQIDLMQSNNKGAVENFTKAIDILAKLGEPKSAAYKDRGFAEFNLKHYWDALEDFNVSLVLDPDQPDVYLGRGKVHMQLKNYRAAIDDFADCMKHGREDAEIHGYHVLALIADLEAKAEAGKNNPKSVYRVIDDANKELDHAETLHPADNIIAGLHDLREQLDFLAMAPNGVPEAEPTPTPGARSGNPGRTAPNDPFMLG